MRRLILLLLLVFASPTRAMPVLDPSAHRYLVLISTDRAIYPPGGRGQVRVFVRNADLARFHGTVVTAIFRNEAKIAETRSELDLPTYSASTLDIPVQLPPSDFRGYRIDVSVLGPDQKQVDAAFGSIDVESGTLPTRFPRQCWISKWTPGIDAEALLDSQVAWRCNIVQAYSAYYRPELAPPGELANWPSLPNKVVSRDTIAKVVAAAHARSIPVLFFQATGEAYDDFLQRNSGPLLDQGSFRRACSTAQPCTEPDMDRSPEAPGNWTRFGWQADHLDLFDLCSTTWQTGLLSRSIKPMLDQFGFDGWQADTLGPPDGPRFDILGRQQDPGACLSDFTSSAQSILGKPVVVNNVMGWHGVETARDGSQPMIYRETWNFDTPSFQQLDLLTDGSAGGLRRYTSRAIIQPGYLQRSLSERCADAHTNADCVVNMASPRLATAMFAIAGSTFMNHMDDGCIATGVFIEGYHLPCPASVVEALLSYKNFEVAYQPLLRDGVTPSAEGCVVTSGAAAGSAGKAGEIYVLGRTKAGFQICQLLNLSGLATDKWSDLDGTMPAPAPANGIAMKLYYVGAPVTPGLNRLWAASPETGNGAAQELSYTDGHDPAGQYVSFTVPTLHYWTMVVLETGALSDDDFHTNPYGLIRGANFSAAPNGIGSAHTVTSGSCCGRWAPYDGVAFGTTSPTAVTFLYGATARSRLTLRLDGPAGPVIGACELAPTGGVGSPVSVNCPVAGATKTRDLYLVFNGSGAAIYNFTFRH